MHKIRPISRQLVSYVSHIARLAVQYWMGALDCRLAVDQIEVSSDPKFMIHVIKVLRRGNVITKYWSFLLCLQVLTLQTAAAEKQKQDMKKLREQEAELLVCILPSFPGSPTPPGKR